MRSYMLAELQLSPVPSLNAEGLAQRPEEILGFTAELPGFTEPSTALGSCRPNAPCIDSYRNWKPLQLLLFSSFTLFLLFTVQKMLKEKGCPTRG